VPPPYAQQTRNAPQPRPGQPGFGGPPWHGTGPQNTPPPNGNARGPKILLLAVAGLVLVAVVAVGATLFFGSQNGDSTALPEETQQDSQPGNEEPDQPDDGPADPPSGEVDKGIEAGYDIFVLPAIGYAPDSEKAENEVLLYTSDKAGWLYLTVLKDSSFDGTERLRDLVRDENKDYMSGFRAGEPETQQPSNPTITYMASIPWSATINGTRGPTKVSGSTTLIHRKDNTVSWVRFMIPADRAAQEEPNRDQMLASIVASQ
jgi:flagellar basal body-associated protein FliL